MQTPTASDLTRLRGASYLAQIRGARPSTGPGNALQQTDRTDNHPAGAADPPLQGPSGSSSK